MRKTAVFVVGLIVAATLSWAGPAALVPSAPAAEPSPGFHGVAPARLLDTRVGSPSVDGIGSGLGPLAAGATVNVRAAGRGGVPAFGVGAVALNLTAANASAPTFVSVWATGEGRPFASILNPAVGDTRPNAVVVALGESGSVTLYNDSGSVDLIVDVTGWFDDGAFHGVVPSRLVDTRIGQGAPNRPLGPNATLIMDVAGHTGVPLAGAESVVLNVTATESSDTSFLTVWPTGKPRPVTSNLNTLTDRGVAALVIVKIGAAGAVNLYNFLGTTHLVVDVMGWFGPGQITGIDPFRLMDTRDGTGGAQLPLFARECVAVQATGRGGVPASGVGAVILSVTATEPSDRSYITAWPNGLPRPVASTVNTAPGLNASNLVVAPVGTGGRVSLYNYAGSVQLVVDVLGWLPGDTPPGDPLPAESNGCLTVSAGPLDLPADLVTAGAIPSAVSDDARYVALATKDALVQLDRSTGTRMVIDALAKPMYVSASGDGSVVAGAASSQARGPTDLMIWQRATGQLWNTTVDGLYAAYVAADGSSVLFAGVAGWRRYALPDLSLAGSAAAGCYANVSANTRYATTLSMPAIDGCSPEAVIDLLTGEQRPVSAGRYGRTVTGDDGTAYTAQPFPLEDFTFGRNLVAHAKGQPDAIAFPATDYVTPDGRAAGDVLADSSPMTSDNSVLLHRFVDDPGGRVSVDYDVARLGADVMSRVSGCTGWVVLSQAAQCTRPYLQSPNGRAIILWKNATTPADLRLVLLSG